MLLEKLWYPYNAGRVNTEKIMRVMAAPAAHPITSGEISPDTSEIRSGSTKRHTTSTQNHITGITKIIFPTQAMSTFTKFKLCAQ